MKKLRNDFQAQRDVIKALAEGGPGSGPQKGGGRGPKLRMGRVRTENLPPQIHAFIPSEGRARSAAARAMGLTRLQIHANTKSLNAKTALGKSRLRDVSRRASDLADRFYKVARGKKK